MPRRRSGASRDAGAWLGAAFDGATTDDSVSADAMRWSPRRASSCRNGVDCSTGLGEVVGPAARRVVARAVTPIAGMAADLADDARRLWHGRTLA